MSLSAQYRKLEFQTLIREIPCAVALSILLHTSQIWAADPATVDEQQRQQARGWLQLQQDQRSYRESVEPLPPDGERSLDRLEWRQRFDAGTLMSKQRQLLDTDLNVQRGAGPEHTVPSRTELESHRQLERQRLEMRIQREILRPSLR